MIFTATKSASFLYSFTVPIRPLPRVLISASSSSGYSCAIHEMKADKKKVEQFSDN
jgi:hypothetical protein